MMENQRVSIKNKAQIKDLLERLRNKLKDFVIINMQGQILGRVKDLFLDTSYHLNVVMSREETQTDSPMYLVSSKYIEHVDTSSRAIFVDLSLELQQLPTYQSNHHKMTEVSGNSFQPSATNARMISSGNAGEYSETNSPETHSLSMETPPEEENETVAESDDNSQVLEEEIVRLLEERLVVNRSKRKVGEVVVRKEIETRIVEVPIQREKLIIEQVGTETKKLAEIDLGQGEVTGVELTKVPSYNIPDPKGESSDQRYTVIGEFVSPKAASNLLDAIALQKNHGCAKVRVELMVENPELQETYQKMFDRCSIR